MAEQAFSSHKQVSSLSISTSRPSTSRSPTTQPFSPVSASPQAPPGQSNATLRQRYCLPDPVAFIYLSEDPVTSVIDAAHELTGYQSYVVEQWACSRTHPTFVITAYTGDPAHKISVGILSVPASEQQWSARLRVYFRALAQYHARSKDTSLGKIMVTNLNGFPTSLNIIPIPGGELKKHRELFYVNEDLKRLGCSGRVGLTLTEPNTSTKAKFYQLYKISQKVTIQTAVVELVSLCQVALMMFGCLAPEYADGLLCDKTEEAINEWWTRIGTEVYNVDPIDGLLGPTTVAALLGLLTGARNRLAAFGAPVAKDVFLIDSTKRAIAYFQKTQGMPRTRRLDRYTLHQLHRATAKQASGEGWKMPRAVKSTVADLSGKGGEMVMEMVGRDKTRIADVETVDIDVFAQEVKGSIAQWLWHGKARKRTTRDMFNEDPMPLRTSLEIQSEAQAGDSAKTTQRNGLTHTRTATMESIGNIGDDEEQPPLRSHKRGTVINRAKGRLKDAVGKRPLSSTQSYRDSSNRSKESLHGSSSPSAAKQSERSSGTKVDQTHLEVPQILESTVSAKSSVQDFSEGAARGRPNDELLRLPSSNFAQRTRRAGDHATLSDSDISPAGTAEPSVAGDDDDYRDEHSNASDEEFSYSQQRSSELLSRRRSFNDFTEAAKPFHHEEWWPRHLSFSIAEDALSTSHNRSTFDIDTDAERLSGYPQKELLREVLLAEQARDLNSRLRFLASRTLEAIRKKKSHVDKIDEIVAQDITQLDELYYPRKEDYAALEQNSSETMATERMRLREAVEDIETLGAKLDYELQGLRSKVEDAEEAVNEYERQVLYTESRVRELVHDDSAHGWWGWIVSQFVDTRRQGNSVLPNGVKHEGNGSINGPAAAS